jgi:hypothetical protein
MFSITTSTYDEDKHTLDNHRSKYNSDINVDGNNDDSNNFILPKIPNYTNHHIHEMIRYNDNKYNDNFGLTYLYNNQYKIKERNEYLYKIRSELNSDELTFMSHSKISKKYKNKQKHNHHSDDRSMISVRTSSSSSSSSSSSADTNIGGNSNSSGSNSSIVSHYYKGYPDYVETKANFPILYNEIHDNIKDSMINNNINSSNSSSIYKSHHSSYDNSQNIYNNITTNTHNNNKKKKVVKNLKKNRFFQFNNDDDNSSKSSDFTFSKYVNDDDEFDNGLSYYDRGEGKTSQVYDNIDIDDDDDNNSKYSVENNHNNNLHTQYVDTSNKTTTSEDIKITDTDNNTMKISNSVKIGDFNDNSSNSIISINSSINKLKNDIDDDDGSMKINNNLDYEIITKPAIEPPEHYQFALKLRPFEITQNKLHNYGYNLIRCNRALHRRDIKLRQERYDHEYHDLQLKLCEEEEDRKKRVQYTKHKSL